MKIKIHRGSSEIGGSCVEISTAKTSILIDIGLPLDGSDRKIDLKGKKIDAVLISHPHMDHYGQIGDLDSSIPVHMGELGKEFIDTIATFTARNKPNNLFKCFRKNDDFYINEIKVTPFLVDHSSMDAYSFLIEAEGKVVFYSGDFRATGYKGFLFKDVINKIKGKKIDALLMEGTCIDRVNTDFPDEQSVANRIQEILKAQKNISFLVSSSSTIDRMVASSLACNLTNKIFVIDIYTAYILELMRKVSKKVPNLDQEHIRVLAKGKYARSHYIKIKMDPLFKDFRKEIYSKKNLIELEEIKQKPSDYLLKVPTVFVPELIKMFSNGEDKPNVIYSMWKGYDIYKELSERQDVNFYYAHTSGHASLQHLKEFADSVDYNFMIPIHTTEKHRYKDYFKNVQELKDGDSFNI